jgi:hypothetical protein
MIALEGSDGATDTTRAPEAAMRRAGVLAGLAIALAFACGGPGYFVCREDGECGGASGVCEAVGACSFPDDACESGRRYGEASTPAIAGECVEIGEASSGSSDGEEPPDPLPDPSTGEMPASSSDTGGPVAEGTTGEACPADWWDCGWSSRHRVTLSRPVGETLEGFTTLVLLGPARVDYTRMQADGEDLRFVSATGAALPFEVERWDPDGVSAAWVHLDTLGGSIDGFWIYYDNPVAEGSRDAAAVWPSPHVAVWHLSDDLRDSTANALDAVSEGDVTTTAGQIGAAQDLSSPDARMVVGAEPALADVFVGGATVSAWMRPRGAGGGGYGRIVQKQGGESGWLFYVGPDERLRFVHGYPGGIITWTTAAGAYALDTWVHAAVVFDASSTTPPTFWIDGVEVPAESPDPVPTADVYPDLELPAVIGNRTTDDRSFDGVLDEIRIARAMRSAAWLAAEVASTRDELLDFGAREDRGESP